MTEDKQERIFSLNVASSYGTANEKGSGLGLILCRDFMVQQGGEIWFDSTPWEGTTFYLSLPAVEVTVGRHSEFISGCDLGGK